MATCLRSDSFCVYSAQHGALSRMQAVISDSWYAFGVASVAEAVTPRTGWDPVRVWLRPRENSIRFTPVQVEAIRSGVNPGLTMVVGPPGTGKTDTAVQAWRDCAIMLNASDLRIGSDRRSFAFS